MVLASPIEIVLNILAIGIVGYLGLAVYLRNTRSYTNRLFFVIAALHVLYVVANYFSLHPPLGTHENQLFWVRAVMLVGAFAGPTFLLFVHTFPGTTIRLSVKYLAVLAVLATSTAVASLTPLVFESLTYIDSVPPTPIPGPAIPLYLVTVPGLYLLGFVLLALKYRRSVGQEKIRILYLLLGAIIAFSLLGVITVTAVTVFQQTFSIVFGPLYPVILMGFIAYAIAKHRFLDIKPLIARAVSFAILTVLVAAAYAATLFVGVQKLFNIEDIETPLVVGAVVLTVVAILTSRPAERFVRRITNKIFFKGLYDSDILLADLTHIMATNIDLDYMTEKILGVLILEMHITKAAFLIVDNHKITDIKSVGYHDNKFQELEMLFHSNHIHSRNFVFENLEEGLLKKIFRRLDISVAIPIKVENDEVAILMLGSKLTGEAYYQKDVDLLNTFASEAGIAIQNAKAYVEIQEFSKKLEIRVEERTRELKESQKSELSKAQDIARLKDEFVFIATHELRTPVAAIRGFLSLVSDAASNFPKDVRNNLNAISAASNNLNQLINDLLETARSEAGTAKIEVKPVDIVPIIETEIKELSPLITERRIHVQMEVPGVIPYVMAGGNKVKEVVTNLLSNAIKYNKEGGNIDISVLLEGSDVVVEVRDTGYGIPKEDQKKVFQKFFRARSKKTQKVLGTGLGLFITRMLVEKMGGKMMFSSVEGKGSTFAFSLPRAKE